MLVVNTPSIPGSEIAQTMGLVRGSTTRARFFGRDIIASFRMLVGGEIDEYTKLLAESREQALQRLMQDAEALGANAVINVRFTTSSIARNAAEILAYGTAVKLAQ